MKNRSSIISRKTAIPLAVILGIILGITLYLSSFGKAEVVNPMTSMNDKRSQVMLEGKGYNIDLRQKQELQKNRKKRVRQEQQKQQEEEQERRRITQQRQVEQQQKKVEQGNLPPLPNFIDIPGGEEGGGDNPSVTDNQGPEENQDQEDDQDQDPDDNQVVEPEEPEWINPDDEDIIDVTEDDNIGPPPEDPEKKPSFETNLENGKKFTGKRARFWVEAKDYRGAVINLSAGKGDIAVWVNGEKIFSEGGGATSRVTYNWPMKKGENTIRIRVEDRRRNYIERSYTVEADTDNQEEAGSVYITVEARVLGIGVLASGQETIYVDDNGAEVLNRFFQKHGINTEYTGNLNSGYYLRRIHQDGIVADVDYEEIEAKIEAKGWPAGGLYDPDSLGEKDFGVRSGWIYRVNDSFNSYGLASYVPQNGHRLRVMFSVYDTLGYQWN